MDGQWGATGSMNAHDRSLSFNETTVLLMLDVGVARTATSDSTWAFAGMLLASSRGK